jgi:hypothetical protein
MKRLLHRLLVLTVLFLVIDIIAGGILTIVMNNSPDGRYYKTNYTLNESAEEIIIFGSSRAEENYVPVVFEDSLGMTCWNAGRGGQSLPFWMAMADGILKRYTPQMAIINVESYLLSNDMNYSFEHAGLLRPFYYKNPEIRPVINQISRFERFLMQSRIYAFNSSFYYLFRPYLIKGIDGRPEDKGWKPRKGIINHHIHNAFHEIKYSNPLNLETVLLFEEFIEKFTSRGVEVYLVMSPDFNHAYKSTATIEYLDSMQNVVFLNFGNDHTFATNTSFYIDPTHMNYEGAKEFTRIVSSKILNHRQGMPDPGPDFLIKPYTVKGFDRDQILLSEID